jgi:hypothetical protein
MTTIFPEVDRDAVRTCLLSHDDRIRRSWVAGTPGLPQCGDMIDIDTQQ